MRKSARWLVVSGAGLFALSFWQLTSLTPTVSTSDLWLWLFMLGLGVALTAMPVKTLALEDFSGEALNKASALVNASQLIFSSVGAAILVTLQVEQTITHSYQLSQSLPAGTTDPAILTKLAAQAGTLALNDIFTVLAYCAIGLMVLSLGLPGKRRKSLPVEQAVTEAEVAESVARVNEFQLSLTKIGVGYSTLRQRYFKSTLGFCGTLRVTTGGLVVLPMDFSSV